MVVSWIYGPHNLSKATGGCIFGKAVSVVTNLLDPDVIVVGGGVGNIDVIYTEGLKSLKEFIFNNRVDVPILKPSLGDSAGVFGAAALVA